MKKCFIKKISLALCVAALSQSLLSKNFTLIDGQMTVTIDPQVLREAQQALDLNAVTPRAGGTESTAPQSNANDSNDSDSEFGSLDRTPQPNQNACTPQPDQRGCTPPPVTSREGTPQAGPLTQQSNLTRTLAHTQVLVGLRLAQGQPTSENATDDNLIMSDDSTFELSRTENTTDMR